MSANECQIAIDFDGTIVDMAFPKIGPLRPHAKEVMQRLHAIPGVLLVIWTCRVGLELEAAVKFMMDEGIPFDLVNHNPMPFTTSNKIYADIYVDDRQAGGLPENWLDIYDLISPQITLCLTKGQGLNKPSKAKE